MINNFQKRLKDRNVTVKDCHLANFGGDSRNLEEL